ncbi:hypothetical protein [Halomarina litorea]|uniref:hypothetical protein n=1 Tax=Halomarina litorea TaxID=2961595 RepID=UPI0020C4A660|nr:hypothetical protein [Halomarina sp. BCD28]
MRRNHSDRSTPLFRSSTLSLGTTEPPSVSGRSLVVTYLFALVVPLTLWVVSYPATAALVAASFAAGGLTVWAHVTFSKGEGGVLARVPGLGSDPQH